MTNPQEATSRQKINKTPSPGLPAGSVGENNSEQGKKIAKIQ
jgi:hypothetical protein